MNQIEFITPAGTARKILDAAGWLFAINGYGRTRIEQIAKRAGVSAGTVYLRFNSKDELFLIAVRHGMGDALTEQRWEQAAAQARHIEHHLCASLPRWLDDSGIIAAIRQADSFSQLNKAIDRLYGAIETRRFGLRIMDRSARDWAKVETVYSQQMRQPVVHEIAQCLARLADGGGIRQLPHANVSARWIVETCAWFAMHRLFSPGGTDIDDETARIVALDHIFHGLQATGTNR